MIVLCCTVSVMPLVYLAIFTPCSYACWFRAAYNAFRSDSSFNFFLFFFVFFFQFCTCVLIAIGPNADSWGMMGWLAVLTAFGDSTVGGIFVLIAALLFTLLAIGQFRLTNFLLFIHVTELIEPILGRKFLTGFHFSLMTLNDQNPQFLITLCIKIHDEHIALFD